MSFMDDPMDKKWYSNCFEVVDEINKKYMKEILPPTRKKVALEFFASKSVSDPGNGIRRVKFQGKIGYKNFPRIQTVKK